MANKTFRETQWFKMGSIEQAPVQDGDETEPDATVLLPIEDRYTGDASAEDTKEFGLHTGTTDYIQVSFKAQPEDDVSVKALVREMKHSKKLYALGAGAAAVCAVFVAFFAF